MINYSYLYRTFDSNHLWFKYTFIRIYAVHFSTGRQFRTILSCLRCYNKAPPTRWLMNHRNPFLTIPETEVQDQGASMVAFWQRPSFWLQTVDFSLSEGARVLSGDSSIRALIPFIRAPHSCPNHLPMAPLSNTITISVRIFNQAIQESTNIHDIAREKGRFVPTLKKICNVSRRNKHDYIKDQNYVSRHRIS